MHEDKLYAIAMQCAKLNDQGCSCNCHLCQFNVFNYVSDVREASLLKANAYTDFHNQQQMLSNARREIAGYNLAPLLLIALIVGMILFACNSCGNSGVAQLHSYTNPANELRDGFNIVTVNNSQTQTLDDEIRYLKANPNKIENVPRILSVMRRQGVRDANGDGKIDCIDHSIAFRNLYGSNAHIIINVNPSNGMNHMFIRVYYGGTKIMDIEPQGTPDRYTMGLIWGVMYNPYYNRDVTSIWGGVI